jgi:hypothetical protein
MSNVNVDSIIRACYNLVGRSFDFTFKHDETIGGIFYVDQKLIDMLHLYEPTEFQGELWHLCANIYWGQGYHTGLYYNGADRLVAVNDDLCATSEIEMEYKS